MAGSVGPETRSIQVSVAPNVGTGPVGVPLRLGILCEEGRGGGFSIRKVAGKPYAAAMSLWIILHILAATLWVGGMLFAHFALRPSLAEQLEPPQRLRVWHAVLCRFFWRVWISVLVLHVSGYAMMFGEMGGMAGSPVYVHIMMGVGWIMTAIFAHITFGPFARLKKAVAAQDWPAGGAQMAQIRLWVTINMVLGITELAIGASGRFWG